MSRSRAKGLTVRVCLMTLCTVQTLLIYQQYDDCKIRCPHIAVDDRLECHDAV